MEIIYAVQKQGPKPEPRPPSIQVKVSLLGLHVFSLVLSLLTPTWLRFLSSELAEGRDLESGFGIAYLMAWLEHFAGKWKREVQSPSWLMTSPWTTP